MKRVTLTMLVLLLVLTLGVSAQASFWLRSVCFSYSPDYGSLGEGLEKVDPYYDTPSRLTSGGGLIFSGGYDFSKTWALRLDTFGFEGRAEYLHLRLPEEFIFKTETAPVLLSLVYRLATRGQFQPYLGAGLGTFRSRLTITSNRYAGTEQKDSPTGFQVFGGVEYRDVEGLFVCAEAAYLSAKAEYAGYRCIEDCSTDWTGVLLNVGLGYSFGR